MLTEEHKAKLIQASLDWCNMIRARDGQEPLSELPKGRMKDPLSCPCGRACSMAVYANEARPKFVGLPPVSESEGFLPPDSEGLPLLVRDFIRYFDQGLIPELVDRGS